MSALNQPVWEGSVVATAVIAKGQAVSYAGAVAAAGTAMLGIAQCDAAIGERVPLTRLGIAAAIAGAAIDPAGGALEVGTTGRLIEQSAGVTVARAMSTASTDDVFEVTLVSH